MKASARVRTCVDATDGCLSFTAGCFKIMHPHF
jgi:hypothetical protein